MKAIIHDWHTQVFPTKDEVEKLCKPGCGADTCVWLTLGRNGMECMNFNREILLERVRSGSMKAKREGCKEINKFNISVQTEREVTFDLLK
jgi:hypothetical protein